MKLETFKKVSGNSALYTSDGKYEFPTAVNCILCECNAGPEMDRACMIEKDGIEYHIVVAWNAEYWKTDGQEEAVHLIAFDPKSGAAYIKGVWCTYTAKDIKVAIRRMKTRIKESSPAEVLKGIEKAKIEYAHQCAIKVTEDESILYKYSAEFEAKEVA